MREESLIQISNKIKEVRKAKNITIQELANRAQVSKGLISQIENNRTVPSLLVLINIIRALKLDLNDFFNDLQPVKKTGGIVLKKTKDYVAFQKETAKGFLYKRIITQNMPGGPMDIVLLELKKGAKRNQLVKTDAFEYKYIIKGTVEYLIDGKIHLLEEGDSLFFDGRLPHKPTNNGKNDALMLVIYFFNEDNENDSKRDLQRAGLG